MKAVAHMQEGHRVIAAEEWKRQRWAWMQGVRSDASLSVTARFVADVLALDFVNVDTFICNPSYAAIAEWIGMSPDTAKRAILELVKAGWITRSTARGRSNTPTYGFITRASVVYLKGGKSAPPKRGQICTEKGANLHGEKGANLPVKGGKSAQAHIILNKPWENHDARAYAGAQAHARARGGKVSSNPMVVKQAEHAVARWRDGRADAFVDLKGFVIDHILGAGLLTDDEIDQAWPGQCSEKGESDDGQ